MSVVFGALLLWDIKELYDQGFTFETVMNTILDAIGVLVPSLSKSGKIAIEGAESLKTIPKASRGLIVKIIEMGKSMIGKIVGGAAKGAEWLSGLFGSGAKSWVSGIIKSLESTLTKLFDTVGGKLVGGSEKLTANRVAKGVSKGVKSGLIFLGIQIGFSKFLETDAGKYVKKRIQKLFGYTDEELNDEQLVLESTKRGIIRDNPILNLKDSDNIKIDFVNNNLIVDINGQKYKNKYPMKDNPLVLEPYNQNTLEISNNIITDYDSVWDYMMKNNKYYTKKKNSSNWILTNGSIENAIKNKVFNIK